MSKATKIVDPFLSVYIFFVDQAGSQLANEWHHRLAAHLGVPPHTPESFESALERLEWDSTQHICLLYQQPDAWVLYLSLGLPGQHPLSAWQTLSETLFGQGLQLWQALEAEIWPTGERSLPSKRYWGASFFFGGQVDDFDFNFDRSRPDQWLDTTSLLPEELATFHATSVYEWGNVWLLANAPQLGPELPSVYLMLAKSPWYEYVKRLFFTSDNFDLLALSLHKCYHGWRQYEQGRVQLHEQVSALDRELKSLLGDREQGRSALNAFSQQYLQFVQWVSQISELQNMMAINATNYHAIATSLRLLLGTDEVFASHWQRLQHRIGQTKADQIYYEQALKRLEIGLDTLRTVLEVRTLDAEQEAAERWRNLRLVQEEERYRRAEEKEKEEQKEKKREQFLVYVALLLGITQLWPILQQSILEACPKEIRFYADMGFIAFIVLATVVLLLLRARNQ